MTLVAAYVTDQGQIVPPPEGVTQATITLTQTTLLVGRAMNDFSGDLLLDYGLGTDPLNRLQTMTVSFVSSQARVPLSVYDYGGWTKLRAAAGGTETDLLALPTNVPGSDDNESSPGNSNNGDSLSDFEEWRGFFINGFHIRTDPFVKDLFVYHTDLVLRVFHGVGYATALGINVYHISPSDVDNDSWLNFNSVNAIGGETPGHRGQKALRIMEFGQVSCPAGECYGLWAPRVDEGVNSFHSVNNTDFIAIWSRTVRKNSPSSPSETVEEQPDDAKIRQTIAHEIGHAISVGGNRTNGLLDHVNVTSGSCPLSSSQRTVMVSGYHLGDVPSAVEIRRRLG